MSKLSEPVAKALQALLTACKGDTKIATRAITGNFSAYNYFFNLIDEIDLLRSDNVDYNDILIALVEGLPQYINATELPSAAAAVEGILTEEELNKLEFINNDSSQQITLNKRSIKELIASHRTLLSANAELSFKNMKYKYLIWKHTINEGIAINNLQNALEELK